MQHCRQLLNSEIELVRKGDIYSLMIEHLMKNNDWNTASQLAAEMKRNLPNDNLAYYIPKGKYLPKLFAMFYTCTLINKYFCRRNFAKIRN